ncbi:MAG: alpha/beta hydrolase [Alphaproteobacteria bacterium]|nr:alpha/beta hydrolase [Alphaproteobacteria bacterium]
MPEFFIPGPRGRLEARHAGAADPSCPVAVVLHPHPLHGGTMNNKVAYAIFRSLVEAGCHATRFNFRGVGRSSGEHAGGDGEVDDALAVVDWMQRRHPSSSTTWIAGFSFGAWIAARVLMKRPEIDRFVLVAPDATTRDWSFLDRAPADGLIIQGSADAIVAPDDVAALAGTLGSLARSLRFEMIEGAGHFFENDMETVRGLVRDYAYRTR